MAQIKTIYKPWYLIWLAPIRLIAWLLLGGWCYWRMLPLSDKVVELIGYEKMTSEQCDVRQSILRKRGKLDETKRCIEYCYKKPMEDHTKGLLYVGLADIYMKKGDWRKAEEFTAKAIVVAEKVKKDNPNQAARIYKLCAKIMDEFEMSDIIPGNNLRRKAKELAETVHAKDQLLKIN